MTEITPMVAAPTRWQIASAAPHRLFFLAGGIQLVLTMGLWLAVLLGRSGVAQLPLLALPPSWVHAFLTFYGLFSFFIFGFLLTVYPRWLNQAPVSRATFVSAFLPMATGVLIYYIGAVTSSTTAAVGGAVYAAGWLVACARLYQVYRSAAPDPYVRTLNIALAIGWVGLIAYVIAIASDSVMAYRVFRILALWGFLTLMLFTVSHRMIPFFSQSALANYPLVRPAWSLPLTAFCLGGHGLLELIGRPEYLVLFDLPLAIVALQHTIAWNFRRSFEVKLLAMLHIAFAWFAVAMTLYAARGLLLRMGIDAIPPNAAQHALTIGFIAAMALAMVSRVTLGHSGRKLWADHLTWYSFLGVNLAALLRVLAEFTTQAHTFFNIAAATVWVVCLLGWAAHYLPIYLTRRVDNRPG